MRSEELISSLAKDLRPVRRVWHPAMSTGVWLLLAVAVIGGAVALFGFRHDLAERLALGYELPQLVSALATGLLAGFAAFQLALPDRDPRWALLPLPAAAGWFATLGWGCLADLARAGPAALQLTTSFSCLFFITLIGLPLTAAVLWLARHAAPLRPTPVAALGGLSAAALASVGLSLIHHLDAAAMVLVWHGMAMAAVTAVASLLGPRVMRAEFATTA